MSRSKPFLLEICNLHGSIFAAKWVASEAATSATLAYANEEEPYWSGRAAGDLAWGDKNINDPKISQVQRLILAATHELLHNTYVTVAKFETARKIAEASCRVMIVRRKEIRGAIFKRVEKKLPVEIIDEISCLQRLLSFQGEELVSLKKVVTVQQLNYLFSVEYLIRLTKQLQLLEQHRLLVEELGLESMYGNLVSPVGAGRFVICTHLLHVSPQGVG